MIGLEVALERPVQAAAGGQEGGMLAGAVVLQRALTPRRDGALQLLGLQIRPPENLEGLTGLNGLAGVGGAGDGQGPVVMAALFISTRPRWSQTTAWTRCRDSGMPPLLRRTSSGGIPVRVPEAKLLGNVIAGRVRGVALGAGGIAQRA